MQDERSQGNYQDDIHIAQLNGGSFATKQKDVQFSSDSDTVARHDHLECFSFYDSLYAVQLTRYLAEQVLYLEDRCRKLDLQLNVRVEL